MFISVAFLRFESEERLLLIEIAWNKKQESETSLCCRTDNDDVQPCAFLKIKLSEWWSFSHVLSHFINSFSNSILSSFSMPGPVLNCQDTQMEMNFNSRGIPSLVERSYSKQAVTTMHDHDHNRSIKEGHRNVEGEDTRDVACQRRYGPQGSWKDA